MHTGRFRLRPGRPFLLRKKACGPPKRRKLLILADQELVHRHAQQAGERQQVIHRGQALAVLPLVDRLRVLEAEVVLQLAHAQPGGAAQLLDVAPGALQIDDREGMGIHTAPPVTGVGKRGDMDIITQGGCGILQKNVRGTGLLDAAGTGMI